MSRAGMLGLLEPAFSVQPTTNCQHIKLKSINIGEGLRFFLFLSTLMYVPFSDFSMCVYFIDVCMADSKSLSQFGKYQKKRLIAPFSSKTTVSDIFAPFLKFELFLISRMPLLGGSPSGGGRNRPGRQIDLSNFPFLSILGSRAFVKFSN